MFQAEVLIIADDIASGRVWADGLRHHSVQSRIIQAEQATKSFAASNHYHLVVIDSHNNGQEALSFCRHIRPKCDKPILLLTYESDDRYHMQAYDAGVDECIAKPISVLLFLAKASAWLRHGMAERVEAGVEAGLVYANGSANGAVVSGRHARHSVVDHAGLTVDQRNRLLTTPDGRSIKLSVLECKLLSILVANRGRVLSTDYLLSRVWGQYVDADRRLLTNLVYRLRHKLETEPLRLKNIRTVEGVGYVFE